MEKREYSSCKRVFLCQFLYGLLYVKQTEEFMNFLLNQTEVMYYFCQNGIMSIV